MVLTEGEFDPRSQLVCPVEPKESHYCIDCNEAHDPRTCGALGPENG